MSTMALALDLGDQRLLSPELGGLSLGAVLPALIGMVLGRKLRQGLPETVCTKVFFGALLPLGVYIALRSFL